MSIHTIAFICHLKRKFLPELMTNLSNWCSAHNIKACMPHESSQLYGHPELGVSEEYIRSNAEMVVVLGGDGTMLSAARRFSKYHIPIAGINFGHLGILTTEESENSTEALERFVSGDYFIDHRLMLTTSVIRDEKIVYSGTALNDVVIQKLPRLRVIDLNITINNTEVNNFRGDGLIFSTPTGSTAYSLSAGGPIVAPNMQLIILCPLNCHTLSARPLITSGEDTIIAKLSCSNSKVDLVLDGQESFELEDNDKILVKKSEENAQIVSLNGTNYYKLLKLKMKW